MADFSSSAGARDRAAVPRARRRRLRITAEVLGLGGLVGLGWLEHGTIARSVAALPRADWRWLVVALGFEWVSLMGFARTQRLILRATGVQVRVRWMAATTFAGNAISVSLPLVGPEAGTLFTFGRFQREAGDGARAGWALAVAGLVSTLVWALILAVGAVVSGSVAALVAGLLLGTAIVAMIVAAPFVLRRPGFRHLSTRGAARVLQRTTRLARRPAGDPIRHIDQAMDRILGLRIGVRDSLEVVGLSLVNWFASVGCLAAAILAVGAPVPWSSLLLVYLVGAAAGSFNLTPGGLGVVEGALAASLVAAGMHSAQALGSVLIFRIVSFWLPALTGWAILATMYRPSQRPDNRPSLGQQVGCGGDEAP